MIRYDRRPYDGELVAREVQTWQEADKIAFEIAKHSRDTEAIRKESHGHRSGAMAMTGGVQESGPLDGIIPGLTVGSAGEVPPPLPPSCGVVEDGRRQLDLQDIRKHTTVRYQEDRRHR